MIYRVLPNLFDLSEVKSIKIQKPTTKTIFYTLFILSTSVIFPMKVVKHPIWTICHAEFKFKFKPLCPILGG